jgi:lipopolysaccharide export system permease protein
MIPPFVVTLVFFTFIFLMAKILDITNYIVNYRISMKAVLLMLVYSVPYFLEFVIPMSVMMAVLLTFLRLSNDNEIIALKAGGMSIYGLLPPVLVFCLMGCLITGYMAIYGLPWGRLSLKELAFNVASSNLNVGLKERTFNDSFKDVMLYINKVDLKNNELIDIFIEDQRNKKLVSTIVAPRGELLKNPDKLAYQLRLLNGSINQVDQESRAVNSISFDTYNVSLDLKKVILNTNQVPKDEKEMSLSELRRYLNDAQKKDAQYYVTLIELHKKFSIPFACLALGLLAVPLGVHIKSARRSTGLGLGLIFFLSYYLLLSAGFVFGESGIYPPAIGMWVPNLVMGSIGVFLIVKTANEHPLKVDFLSDLIRRIMSCFSR